MSDPLGVLRGVLGHLDELDRRVRLVRMLVDKALAESVVAVDPSDPYWDGGPAE